MTIQAEKFKIEMTENELWDTAFNIKHSLEHDFKDHWVNHQGAWKKNEESRINRIKMMFLALGRPDLYEDIFNEAEKIFAEYNKKQPTKN